MDLLKELANSQGDLDQFAKKLPCILHINDPQDFSLVYLDPYLRNKLYIPEGQTFEEAANGLAFVHPDDLPRAVESTQYYLDHVEEFSTVSFTQRVLLNTQEYTILYTTSLLMEDLGGLVSFSVEINDLGVREQHVHDIIEETDFIKCEFEKFGRLTSREREMMQLWVKNHTTEEMATALAITPSTIKTYKKRIYNKLEINSFVELCKFASAFDHIN